MIVNFIPAGRLGNAIFRYMASVIICIYYNGKYNISNNSNYPGFRLNDNIFLKIIEGIENNNLYYLPFSQINMNNYYQDDDIYKKHKEAIFEFIENNPQHYVLPDSINAGDGKREKFYMIDILKTPLNFNKKYKNVLHIRLEDFVKHNLYLNCERILNLLDKNIISESLCIVCNQPTTDFEYSYIKSIKDHLENMNISVFLEHNDVITDFYIMKCSETLICSKSTLSWCAAFFSTSIKKCYLPDYDTTPNSTCKYPIDNTELY
jgi:hypothetical protein